MHKGLWTLLSHGSLAYWEVNRVWFTSSDTSAATFIPAHYHSKAPWVYAVMQKSRHAPLRNTSWAPMLLHASQPSSVFAAWWLGWAQSSGTWTPVSMTWCPQQRFICRRLCPQATGRLQHPGRVTPSRPCKVEVAEHLQHRTQVKPNVQMMVSSTQTAFLPSWVCFCFLPFSKSIPVIIGRERNQKDRIISSKYQHLKLCRRSGISGEPRRTT